MKRGVIVLIFIVLVLSIGLVSASWIENLWSKLSGNYIQLDPTDVCQCNSCTNCNSALNSSTCNTILVTGNFDAVRGNCIIGINNKILDCQRNRITGITGSTNFAYLKNKNNMIIKNCIIVNFKTGFLLEGSSNNQILNNNMTDFVKKSGPGISIVNKGKSLSQNNSIIGNDISKSKSTGISISGPSNIIRENSIHHNKAGIVVSSGAGSNNLEGNSVENNYGLGINILSKDNKIINQRIFYNNLGGIIIAGDNNEITNLNTHDNKQTGIYVKGKNNNLQNIHACNNSVGTNIIGKDIKVNSANPNSLSMIFCGDSSGVAGCMNCINSEQGLCTDNIDNNGNGLVDCQDPDCQSPCTGDCGLSICDSVTHQWSCDKNQSACSSCHECQEAADNRFNCNPLTQNNFGSCGGVNDSCIAGICTQRLKCDATECPQIQLPGAEQQVLNASGVCVSKSSLCGDNVSDTLCGETSQNCLVDVPQCSENSNCSSSYSNWTYVANEFSDSELNYISRQRNYFQGFCNLTTKGCGSIQVTETENYSRMGDSNYCTNKKQLTGKNCTRNEFDCDSNSECGNLACMSNSVSRTVFNVGRLSDRSLRYLDGCCIQGEEEWYISPKGYPDLRACIKIQYQEKCYNNRLYWYNELGMRKNISMDCVAEGLICKNGACIADECEDDSDCDDGIDCTLDRCNETSSGTMKCFNDLQQGKCLIDNKCYENNQLKPEIMAYSCYKCNAASPNKWSLLNQTETCSQTNSFGAGLCGDNICSVTGFFGGYDCGNCINNDCYSGTCGNDNFCAVQTRPLSELCGERVCGNDTIGCGMSCGTCTSGLYCNSTGGCDSNPIVPLCIPDNNVCAGKQCGNFANGTGCGDVSCGTCASGTCNLTTGQCILPPCTPTNCSTIGKQCGIWDDGCGTGNNITCGSCSSGYSCNTTGNCAPLCTSNCSTLGYACGNFTICGNNISCGLCSVGKICNSTGKCNNPVICSPNLNVCSGKECGRWLNGTCGNATCGNCASGKICNSTGKCVSSCVGSNCNNCVPDCGNSECGNDNCNNVNGCGTCASGETCSSGNCITNSVNNNCGNGNCDSGEDSTNCSADCEAPTPKLWIWILIIAIIVVAIVIVVLIVIKNKKKKPAFPPFNRPGMMPMRPMGPPPVRRL